MEIGSREMEDGWMSGWGRKKSSKFQVENEKWKVKNGWMVKY